MSIGGLLDAQALAMLHRPTDPEALRREARHLLTLGLAIPDAAQALGMTPAALAALLNSADTPEDATRAHD